MRYKYIHLSNTGIFVSTVLVLAALGKIEWKWFWICFVLEILNDFTYGRLSKDDN